MEMQPADPGARRRALVLVIVGIAVGALLIWAFDRGTPALQRWLTEDRQATRARIQVSLVVFALFVVVPPVAFGVYMWSIGNRVRRHGRFPPPGLTMIAATPVLTGDAAQRRAAILQMLGAFIAAAWLALAVVLWRLAVTLAR